MITPSDNPDNPVFFSKFMDPSAMDQILSWRYPPPYDCYNLEPADNWDEDIEYFLNADNQFFSVWCIGTGLVGYYCFGDEAQVPGGPVTDASHIDIGLGMKPALTGKGWGPAFTRFVSDQARMQSGGAITPRLSVAKFNKRAIRVYQRAGYYFDSEFLRATDGVTFSVMLGE